MFEVHRATVSCFVSFSGTLGEFFCFVFLSLLAVRLQVPAFSTEPFLACMNVNKSQHHTQCSVLVVFTILSIISKYLNVYFVESTRQQTSLKPADIKI